MGSNQMPSAENRYTKMQHAVYEREASQWSLTNRDRVVGSFDAHNAWADYNLLFEGIPDLATKRALDFGCGPGRNLVRFGDRIGRIDGVDMNSKNLDNARVWLTANEFDPDDTTLYVCNGVDLAAVPSTTYDIVFSTICFQHICVHEIRYGYLTEFFRVLKPGGVLTMQMGYGSPSPYTVDYYANHYDATGTNRGCDTEVKHPSQIETDLVQIGFKDFSYAIRPVGPGDCHPAWIFFKATKPEDPSSFF
jgi:ubiquinone/menaquinone biosynthesis C-methylase UbiE